MFKKKTKHTMDGCRSNGNATFDIDEWKIKVIRPKDTNDKMQYNILMVYA